MNGPTIVIIDTQGPNGIPEDYRLLLPNCRIEGHEPAAVAGRPCHPHGLMCGYLAGVIQRHATRLVFLRIFDGPEARQINGATDWALSALASLDLPPGTVINRSWGMAAPGSMAVIGRVIYSEWVERYSMLLAERGWVDFGAAGNSDKNTKAPDISYPQAMMPEDSNIIGSHDRAGTPSVFSSDGPGLQCLFWAERILLREANRWAAGSGTSFASPKAAGVCALRGLDNANWRQFVAASSPECWAEPWHPKFGLGSREHLWQNALLNVPSTLWPPCQVVASVAGAAGGPLDWLDYDPATLRLNTSPASPEGHAAACPAPANAASQAQAQPRKE